MSDDTEAIVAFQQEVMFAGWAENHTSGAKITFYLSDPSQLDYFRQLKVRSRGHAGQRMMMVLVEIDDDDKPVDQQALANAANKGGAIAKLAGMWCANPDFHGWLQQAYPKRWEQARTGLVADHLPTSDEDIASEVVRRGCAIGSRAELDHSKDAQALWESHFRKPFMATQGDHA